MMQSVPGGGSWYRKILFCTDFSPNADDAFEHALAAVRSSPEAIFFLLHVIPEPEAQFWKTYLYEVEGIDGKAKQDIDRKIDETYQRRLPADLTMQRIILIGRPQDAILQLARDNAVDLIVLGRQGHSSWGKVLFGNVSEAIVRKAECAVLVVPHAKLVEDMQA